jgi:hypothetical protein
MAEIIAELFDDRDNGALRIKWYRGSDTHRAYCVRRETVEKAAQRVRGALQDLVDAGREKKYDDYPDLVRRIAEQGHHFYNILFSGINEDDRRHAERAKEWVAGRPSEDIITFTVPSRIHIPWGLIYDQPSSENPEEIDRERFWCLKHAAAAHYFDSRPEWVDVQWPAQNFGVLFGAHEELWRSAHRLLGAPDQQRLFRLLSFPNQPKFCLNEIHGLWEKTKGDNRPPGLLCFYCHASGTDLLIGIETLSATDFEQQFARLEIKNRPPTLVFLAGCRTAIGSLNVGFLEVTSAPGFCGFIGAEVLVPDLFTLRFLSSFINRLFGTGQSVREVMRELRRKHWPLSLAFSVCCTGELRLAPSETMPLDEDSINLSYQPVSSE